MSTIRKATVKDISAMALLWRALVLEENPDAKPDLYRWCRVQEDLFKNKMYYVYVAEEDGKVVGFNNGLFLYDMETNQPYVEGGNFYVLPEYRKGPCGMRLHRNSLKVVKGLGAKYLRRKVSVNNKRMMDRLTNNLGKTHFIKEYIVDEMIA
jgi:GNAT superfamily N-acetyltransferase